MLSHLEKERKLWLYAFKVYNRVLLHYDSNKVRPENITENI